MGPVVITAASMNQIRHKLRQATDAPVKCAVRITNVGVHCGPLWFQRQQWRLTHPVYNTCMARLDYELTSPSDSRWEMKDVDVVFSDESSLPAGPAYWKNTKVPHIFDLQAAEKVTVPDGWVFFFLQLVHLVIGGTTNGRFVFGALHPVGDR